jgi:3-methylfumaryl-CoA hydratase
MPIDIAPLKGWVGRQESAGDVLAPFQANALAVTLDRDEAYSSGDPLPPLWHWIYLQELHKTAELADNGHGRLGGFMPPVPLPRRMWAGGRFTFERPLRIGQAVERVSTVVDLTAKQGASGDLVFLLLRHTFSGPDGAAVVEEQDIVYREAPRAREGAAAPRRAYGKAIWRHETMTSEALLFRYSALIFNAHRIHYDRPYCEREGYPGLIVHGPLLATLLADLVRRNTEAPMTAFRFRAVSPLFGDSPCVACGIPEGRKVTLWAEDGRGGVVMDGQAELASNA